MPRETTAAATTAVAVAAAAATLRLLRQCRQQQRFTINGVKTKVINLYYKWVMTLFKQISNTLLNLKNQEEGDGEREREAGQQSTSTYFAVFYRRMRAARTHNSQYSHCDCMRRTITVFHEFRGKLAHSVTIEFVLFSISFIPHELSSCFFFSSN